MQIIKRILTFVSVFFLYIIFREFLQLYFWFSNIHQWLGFAVIVFFLGVIIYFIGIPVYKILKLEKYPEAASDPDDEEKVIAERLKIFRSNKKLKADLSGVDPDFTTQKQYELITAQLKTECHKIRKNYVRKIFYSTSVAQNGFLDAILILSSSVNLVKEIFTLYNGRSSWKDLITIGKKIYFAMAIAGSEGIEVATEELFSKLSTEGLKSIPFIDKILGSIADGYVNALMLTRISYITENYCLKAYAVSEKDYNPSAKFVIQMTKDMTFDIVSDLRNALSSITSNRFKDFTRFAARPVRYVWDSALYGVNLTSSNVKFMIQFGSGILNRFTGLFSKYR
jgi:hypothetical protein